MIARRGFIARALRIVNLHGALYNALLLGLALVPAVGCGSKPAPPPGAEKKTDQPAIDIGTESDSMEPSDSPTDAETPADEQGDTK